MQILIRTRLLLKDFPCHGKRRRNLWNRLGTKKAKQRAGVKEIAKSGDFGIMKLPRAEKCVIPKAKFTEYALNPAKDPDKAEAFRKALGYTSENADELITQIQSKISSYEAVERGDNGYGMTYQVVMDIDGPNGKCAKVLTAWMMNVKGETRLTTVHID